MKDCGYATPDEMVRDAIVFGTKDHTVRENCINEGSDLTIEKAVNFGRTLELSKAQLKSMAGEDKSVNIVSKSKQGHSPRFNTGRYHNKPESKTKSHDKTKGDNRNNSVEIVEINMNPVSVPHLANNVANAINTITMHLFVYLHRKHQRK